MPVKYARKNIEDIFKNLLIPNVNYEHYAKHNCTNIRIYTAISILNYEKYKNSNSQFLLIQGIRINGCFFIGKI